MDSRNLIRGSVLACCLVLALPAVARAHPHIFAEARLEVDTASDHTISELRHVWRFDEVFSSSVVIDFDANKNLVLDPDELASVSQLVKDSLMDFDYYTTIIDNGADIGVTPPDSINVDYRDGQLLMFFAVRPSKPVALTGKLDFGVYDPTMYAAIDFLNDSDMVVTGSGAAGCTHKVIRPDPDQVIAENQASLTEAFFENPGGNDLSKLFATRIELTCK
ncbi:DUF1007 family protein [Hoeflea marina]|nr:DUF1007 family protein [Hoeflea marina]